MRDRIEGCVVLVIGTLVFIGLLWAMVLQVGGLPIR